jgi:small-conductance mechanosensitive channel
MIADAAPPEASAEPAPSATNSAAAPSASVSPEASAGPPPPAASAPPLSSSPSGEVKLPDSREATPADHQRTEFGKIALSLGFAVVFGLLALYLVRKVGGLARRVWQWLDQNPERVPAIRLKSIEVVGTRTLRSALLTAVGLGKWLVQFAIVYAWLVCSLWLYPSTRGYAHRMTGVALSPVSGFIDWLSGALPLALVAVVAGVAVLILLRFVALFFEGVSRGETELAWLPADLAPATSLLIRTGIVVTALFFATPLVTGDLESGLTRLGIVLLGALALSSTPLAASVVVGAWTLYTRRLTRGDYVEVGGRSGRILEVDLWEVRLSGERGEEVRVPHLLTLFHPTRVFGARPVITVAVSVTPGAPPSKVLEILTERAQRHSAESEVRLLGADADGVHYLVSLSSDAARAETALLIDLLDGLGQAKIALGRRAVDRPAK